MQQSIVLALGLLLGAQLAAAGPICEQQQINEMLEAEPRFIKFETIFEWAAQGKEAMQNEIQQAEAEIEKLQAEKEDLSKRKVFSDAPLNTLLKDVFQEHGLPDPKSKRCMPKSPRKASVVWPETKQAVEDAMREFIAKYPTFDAKVSVGAVNKQCEALLGNSMDCKTFCEQVEELDDSLRSQTAGHTSRAAEVTNKITTLQEEIARRQRAKADCDGDMEKLRLLKGQLGFLKQEKSETSMLFFDLVASLTEQEAEVQQQQDEVGRMQETVTSARAALEEAAGANEEALGAVRNHERKVQSLNSALERLGAKLESERVAGETWERLKDETVQLRDHLATMVIRGNNLFERVIREPLRSLGISPNWKLAETFASAVEETTPAQKGEEEAKKLTTLCEDKKVQDDFRMSGVDGLEQLCNHDFEGTDGWQSVVELTRSRRETIKQSLVKLMNALDPLLGIEKKDEQAYIDLEMSDLRPFISSFGSSALYTQYMQKWAMDKTKSGKPKPGKYEMIYLQALEKTRAAIDLHAAQHEEAQGEFDAAVLQVNQAQVTLRIVQSHLEKAKEKKGNAKQAKQQQEALLARARQEKKQLDDLYTNLLKRKEQAEAAFNAAKDALNQANQEAQEKGRTGILLQTQGRTRRLRGVFQNCDNFEDED